MLNFEKTIDLSTSLDNTTFNDYAPLSLTINPSSLNVSKKIYKIEYVFDDEIKTQTFFYKKTTADVLPFPSEIGDPRNYTIHKTFYITSSASTTQNFGVTANVYQFGVSTPTKIKINLNLSAPKMDGTGGIFNSVELLYTRIFGVNNDILYVFESVNPSYYIPVVINWESIPQVKPKIDLSSKSLRAFDVTRPFQITDVENPYNIKFIDKQKILEVDPETNC